MKRPAIRVSDHAVLRYLQRVGGFDVEGLRDEIVARVAVTAAPGATGVTIDGYSYRIAVDETGPIVATVIRAEGSKSLLRPARSRR